MTKFCVKGDPNNKPNFSSSIIIEGLNQGAKKADIYSENGVTVTYDCIGNHHGHNPHALITCYELTYPKIIIDNLRNLPTITVSRDNLQFLRDAGYPENLSTYVSLGVDSEKFSLTPKVKRHDTFNVGVYSESLVRGGIELALEAFAMRFRGNKNAVLMIKDRNATPQFQNFVRDFARKHGIRVEYQNAHWDSIDQIKEFFSAVDCHLYLNRSSTFAMPPLEGLSMGVPTICLAYSGPRDYIEDGVNALVPKHDIQFVDEELSKLVSIGCRNFFFAGTYLKRPTWARAKTENVAECLDNLYYNNETRIKLAQNGRITAENMSWESAATNLFGKLKDFGLLTTG